MTEQPIRRALPRTALLVAALAMLAASFLAIPSPAAAASAVQMEARALVAGRYEAGGWAAVSVSLVNPGEPTDGYLVSSSDAGTVRRYVELPAGAQKSVILYLQPDAFQRRVEVRYEEPNGTVTASVDVRVFESSSRQSAIVGDGAGTIRPQLAGGVDVDAPEPIALGPADLPDRAEPLAGLDAIVWAGDSSTLSEDHRRSLESWVGAGGNLVVVGGPDWQARTAGFADLLPLENLSSSDSVEQAALADWTGTDAPAAGEDTVSTGTLRDDATALVTADDGSVLASMRNVGAGRVILLGVDVATDAYRGWEGSPRLWTRLLPSNAIFESFFGFPVEDEMRNSITQALGSLPSLDVPPAELLLVVIVAYILLIGPISYIVLRRMDRRELAWVTAPLLVIVFTACSYGIGNVAKGGEVIVNQISLIRSSTAGTTASVETYAGIFSPTRETYDVSVDADALVGRLRPPGFEIDASTSVADQGRPAHLRGLSIGVFGFEGVSAVGEVEHTAALDVSWRTEAEELIGTVTNLGDTTIEDVAFISQSGGDLIGDLEPGASAEFEVTRANVNGSAASEQVYGFGGMENATDEQREISTRRLVIDSLVGYGGFAPGMDIAGVAIRGPYVIGWRTDDGPMPVSVDGLDARRSTATVEVVSVRPAATSGQVVISPTQMSVAVTGMEGNASSNGPGMVVVNGGSATFELSLPLDAAGMAVTDVEIIVGPDPSMALDGSGQFGGGFWPPETIIELRDPATGEWSVLGDLSERSGFELEDPAGAFGEAGTLTVRVTGAEVDPNFGQSSVFVTARATGVLGE